jgi:dihydroorotate dehydrogenase (fumarate)
MSVNVSTRYLGFELQSPLVVSASPLTLDLERLHDFESAGAGAAVLPSLFEEQIEHDQWAVHNMHEFHAESSAESLGHFPDMDAYNTGPEPYLAHVRAAKETVNIPIIGSLNGATPGGWTRYAALIEQAGADALELNIYIIPTDLSTSGQEIERRYIQLVADVREAISIPLAVKTGPFFSSIPAMAKQFVDAGADGLTLFNRFLEPDIDLEALDVVPQLDLSSRAEMRLPLRWIAILRDQLSVSLAATSGIHESDDVLKVLLAGADVAMMASAFFRHGPQHLRSVLDKVRTWLAEHEYESVTQLKGSVSHQNCADPTAYERANYMNTLLSYSGKFI